MRAIDLSVCCFHFPTIDSHHSHHPMMMTVLPDGTPGQALSLNDPEATPDQIEGQVRISSIQRLVTMVQTQPDAAMTVLRGWMTEEDSP